ncbi:MAG: hypothetical protein IJB70_05600, partial [Clostridia bacterium]|nr:hypothetical protein [Clostridia bacterium]
IVQRSFCDKFIARQGKSTVNTWCINEHFDEVLRRIYCKNRTLFESPTANAQYLSFVMLSEAVGEVETSKNEILRLR